MVYAQFAFARHYLLQSCLWPTVQYFRRCSGGNIQRQFWYWCLRYQYIFFRFMCVHDGDFQKISSLCCFASIEVFIGILCNGHPHRGVFLSSTHVCKSRYSSNFTICFCSRNFNHTPCKLTYLHST